MRTCRQKVFRKIHGTSCLHTLTLRCKLRDPFVRVLPYQQRQVWVLNVFRNIYTTIYDHLPDFTAYGYFRPAGS